MKNIIGRKVGMTSVFTADGRYVPVTVIEAGPCTVVQRKTKETDGYEAVALAFGDVKKSRVTRALAGHYKKAGIEPKRDVREFRTELEGLDVGRPSPSRRSPRATASTCARTSKGHGFAGGIKRHNFSGGGASHGSMIHRQPASNGDTNAGHVAQGQPPSGSLRRRQDHPPESRDRARRRRAQSAARARSGSRSEERPRRRHSLGQGRQGHRSAKASA